MLTDDQSLFVRGVGLDFRDYTAFQTFSYSVRFHGRFALSSEAQHFLKVFRHQAQKRRATLPTNVNLFRAVRHYEEVETVEGGLDIRPASEERLRPKPQLVTDGRVNPRGIACLYLASSIDTAISEVRPWLDELLSVGYFRPKRAFMLVDLSEGHGKWGLQHLSLPQLFAPESIPPETVNRCVWTDIDSAFSRPVSSGDNAASYVPTQILAEALREEGYEGLIYKSSFGGEKGYNVALFDGTDTEIVKCALHEVKAISIEHSEAGNAWYRRLSE